MTGYVAIPQHPEFHPENSPEIVYPFQNLTFQLFSSHPSYSWRSFEVKVLLHANFTRPQNSAGKVDYVPVEVARQ